MSVLGALAIFLGGILWLVVLRLLAGHLAYKAANSSLSGEPDGADWTWALLLGVLAPVWLPGLVAFRLARMGLNRLPRVGAEARYLARQRAQRTAELERELLGGG